CQGFHLNLLRPRTFSEKMQWRKLFDLNPLYAIFCDRLPARDYIVERVGADLAIPVLWAGENPDEVPFETLQRPYVIKSNHGSGQTIIVTDDDQFDVARARAAMRRWLDECHGGRMDGPGFCLLPRRVVVERCLLDRDGKRPAEL